jgi:KipI family sensor histidine kinase inhibitor
MHSHLASRWPRFLPCGDAALTVELGESADRATNIRVVRLFRALTACPPEGVVETVPAFRSLLVQFDPLRTSPADLQRTIEALFAASDDTTLPSRQWQIPVCYYPELAVDMTTVAAATGLTPSEIVEIHASTIYYVYMVGFLPGFGYLGDLPTPLHMPRRADPRINVPCGGVAIATRFTAIYPLESPGGWHVIGQTPAPMIDIVRGNVARLAPGDTVQFQPVSLDAFTMLASQSMGGAALAMVPPAT